MGRELVVRNASEEVRIPPRIYTRAEGGQRTIIKGKCALGPFLIYFGD
jgi:hypothetical protein